MSLRGSRCVSCGRTVFPGAVPCPLCAGAASFVDLPPDGVVETYTAMGSNVVGEVRLEDGTLVLGRLEVTDPAVGRRVSLRAHDDVITFG